MIKNGRIQSKKIDKTLINLFQMKRDSSILNKSEENISYPSILVVFVLFCISTFFSSCNNIINYKTINDTPDIFPDYINVAIPYNIAPLNFSINNKADKYAIKIFSKNGNTIWISQKSKSVVIPEKKWHQLLSNNKENLLFIDVFIKNNGKWQKFESIKDSIVSDPIDPYLAYRLINNVNILWREMGIYQRNLENFEETPIFRNRSNNNGCVNCHNFNRTNPAQMTLHFRKENPGTVIFTGDSLEKLNTKTPFTISAFAYPAWHPSGKYIAYVVNTVNQIFSSDANYHDVVFDGASDIVIYNIEKNTVTTSPKISSKNRENMPSFSADGQWLYYISAPEAKNDSEKIFSKYSLVRIAYNAETSTWGNVDTLISSSKTGKSISFPRVSPDGRYILFSQCRYSYFSTFDKTSDLCMYDTLTQTYQVLPINSPYAESYHTWSKSGRWIVFSSRRLDNGFSRPFFAYFDKKGIAHKPFVMPQKDPELYHHFLKHYNLPEFISGKVNISENQLRDFISVKPRNVIFDTTSNVDAVSGATYIKK
jgi:hypothetical protein